jgi:hypothetical protein
VKSAVRSIALILALAASPAFAQGVKTDAETIRALTARIDGLEKRLTKQEDIESVRLLAFTYGYYMDNALYSQVQDLWSPKIESCEIAGYGVYKGYAGCARMWREVMGSYYGGASDKMIFGRLTKHYLLKDVITVDGDTAKGRFDYMSQSGTYGQDDRTGGQVGIYSFDFVKEGGIWKIAKFWLSFNTISYNFRDFATNPSIRCPSKTSPPDAASTLHHPFPEVAMVPFTYPNPVTGKPIEPYVDPTHYWQGNWPGEFGGPCGKRADAPKPVAPPRAPTGN